MSNNTFEKWQDALPYIGKQVGVRVVESPDIKGKLTGLTFYTNDKTGEIEKVWLTLNGWYGKFEFWECYPVEKITEVKPVNVKSDFPYKVVAAVIGTIYLIVGIFYLVSK